MQTNECFVCGGNDFTVTDGAFVCNECGIQSQVSVYNLINYFSKENINIILCNIKVMVLHLKLGLYYT